MRDKQKTQRARELRRDMTDAERFLWRHLRAGQLGHKFRLQHPIGPYIVDSRVQAPNSSSSSTAANTQARRAMPAATPSSGVKATDYSASGIMTSCKTRKAP